MSLQLSSMPLILAGPIVRFVNKTRVTVWVALKSAATVTLKVQEAGSSNALTSPTTEAVQIGSNLYLALADLDLTTAGISLDETKVYFYNLVFSGTASGDLTTPGNLTAPGIAFSPGLLSYAELTTAFPGQSGLPSFVLPQSNLANLCIAQGSCRKAHAQSIDALLALDVTIGANTTTPAKRPQQLFLTGDQIYADDVGDATLSLIDDLASTLVGETELTPGTGLDNNPDLAVGNRDAFMKGHCAFTTDDGVAKSHLVSFGEYCLMHVLMFSPSLWPDPEDLATFQNIYPDKSPTVFGFSTSDSKRFSRETDALKAFIATAVATRRTLANVSTYMLLDDHDVTDDFYMDRAWLSGFSGRSGVLTLTAGLAVIRNALLAYALFQGWGNAPDSFDDLLPLVAGWAAAGLPAGDTTFLPSIVNLLGVPSGLTDLGDSDLEFKRSPGALDLNFQLTFDNYEVLALDTRSHRAYPTKAVTGRTQATALLPASLLSPQAMKDQIPAAAPTWQSSDGGVTFVITPGPWANISLFEDAQLKDTDMDTVFVDDVELLHFDNQAFDTLIARLAARSTSNARIVVLCGDVHFSYATRIDYWSPTANPLTLDPNTQPNSSTPSTAVVAQLVCSSAKNQSSPQFGHIASGTFPLHYSGFNLSRFDIPRLGWVASNAQSLTVGNGVALQPDPNNPGGKIPVPGTKWAVPVDTRPDGTYSAAVTELVKESNTFQSVTPTVAPSWRMRRRLIVGSTTGQNGISPPATVGDPGANLLDGFISAFQSWFNFVNGRQGGRAIVGVNNIGVVTLNWETTPKSVTQTVLWFGDDYADLYKAVETMPLTIPKLAQTTVTVPLDAEAQPDPTGTIDLPIS